MATIKQLEAEFNEQLAEIRGQLRKRSRTWLIAAGAGLILLMVLLLTVFKRKTVAKDDDYKGRIEALDSTIKYQQRTIDALQFSIAQQDSLINHLDVAYKNNRPAETRIIHRYETIPNTVRDLNREQLRREVADY